MTTAAPSLHLPETFRLIENGVDIPHAELISTQPEIPLHGPALSAADTLRRLLAGAQLNRPVTLGELPEPAPPQPDTGFTVTLLTSGTTGAPKAVRHTPEALLGRVRTVPRGADARWLLTYHPAGFAGLQVLLTALINGATLIAAPGAGVPALAALLGAHTITHASGTPAFWRTALMSLPNTTPLPHLRSITLGGEAVDQPLLDALTRRFPNARLRHIYALTEAGALFAVTDGRAGFPASWLETGVPGWDLAVRDDVLCVRRQGQPDWIETGDLITLHGDRALFTGRVDDRVNVGGVKVDPLAVETRLLSLPEIADAVIDVRASPITGALLTARIVPAAPEDAVKAAIRVALAGDPPAAQPRRIEFVNEIPLSPNGKKQRLTPDRGTP